MSEDLELKTSDNSNEISDKKKWRFKDHWKPIVIWSSIILVFIIGYILVAGIGAPEFKKTGDVKYPAVEGGFKDPAGAINWYFNVVLIDNFLGVPAILLGVLSFVGYMVLKRGFVDSFIGAIKTSIGVLLLSIGSSALSGIVSPIFSLISKLKTGVLTLDPYIGWSSGYDFLGTFAKNSYVSWVSYALLIGFVFNIIMVALKRWTNCHAVMTTGHIMFQQSAVVVPFIYILFFNNTALNSSGQVTAGAAAATIIFSGIFVGTYWSVGTTLTIKPTNEITENANFAIGHQQMLGVSIAYRLGRFFKFTKKGQEIESAEHRKLSKKFRIFEDNVFVQSILMVVLFLVLFIVLVSTNNLKGDTWEKSWWVSSTGNIGTFWVVQVIMGSLAVVASILAIVTGVRMFVTELQQSFQGISEKVIPGSVVAVDIAAVYGFSPNSVTYGFISGTIGQFLAVGITIGLSFIPGANNHITIVVPLFITLFFNSGAVGVYANVKGGWKAAIILPFLLGFLEILVISFALASIIHKAIDQGVASGSILQYVKDGKVITPSPVATGYNGMIDWNLLFGFPLIFAAMNPIVAYVIMPLEVVIMLIAVQYADSGLTDKVPPLKKMLPINKIFASKNKNVEPVMV